MFIKGGYLYLVGRGKPKKGANTEGIQYYISTPIPRFCQGGRALFTIGRGCVATYNVYNPTPLRAGVFARGIWWRCRTRIIVRRDVPEVGGGGDTL